MLYSKCLLSACTQLSTIVTSGAVDTASKIPPLMYFLCFHFNKPQLINRLLLHSSQPCRFGSSNSSGT